MGAKIYPFKVRNAEGYGLVLRFEDQSNSFTHGFECGIIWQKLKDKQVIDRETINTENKEQIQQMAEVHHRIAEFEDIADGWTILTIE